MISDDPDYLPIQFLFRKRGKARVPGTSVAPPASQHKFLIKYRNGHKQVTQWTDRFAGLADESNTLSGESKQVRDVERPEPTEGMNVKGTKVSLRLEGPYFCAAEPSRYEIVVCLVAGTGISGAIAIGASFNEAMRLRQEGGTAPLDRWRKCDIIWSVKERDDIDLPFLQPMAPGLSLRKYLTGPGRSRVELGEALADAVVDGGRIWVYISGPTPFIKAGEDACKVVKEGVELEFHAANWDI